MNIVMQYGKAKGGTSKLYNIVWKEKAIIKPVIAATKAIKYDDQLGMKKTPPIAIDIKIRFKLGNSISPVGKLLNTVINR